MSFLARRSPVTRFVLGVLFWLILCLFVWSALAPAISWPLAVLADLLMGLLFSDQIASVELLGRQLEVVTRIPLPAELLAQYPAGMAGDLVVGVNPLIYSYGLPLFSALVLATPGSESMKWRQWLTGVPLLYIGQTWGVVMDVLKTLLFSLGAETAAHFGSAALLHEAVALGYQLGALILPPVLPLAIWIVMNRAFLMNLVGQEQVSSETPGPDV
ncbi:MAG: exosortase H-associated membrane protein [Candidatus Thiodiazotropha sp.]